VGLIRTDFARLRNHIIRWSRCGCDGLHIGRRPLSC
jgi:hypothetical protein